MHILARFAVLLLTLSAVQVSSTVAKSIASGPLLGPIHMREATIWVQTTKPSIVRVIYQSTKANSPVNSSQTVTTTEANGLTAHLRLNKIEPGQKYDYQVEIDGAKKGGTFQFKSPSFYHDRTPPPDFRVALCGSHYVIEEGYEPPYQVLGGGYQAFKFMQSYAPDMMIWTGNTAHLRLSDTSSLSGTRKRFVTARNVKELSPLIATIPNYASWGQTDYGKNFPGKSYTHRNQVEKVFREFWPAPTKTLPIGGLTTHFSYADADFFFLDVNTHRNDTPTTGESTKILGDEQIKWLRQEIRRSQATFKVIIAGAPILNPAKSRTNLSYAETEQTKLLQMLREEGISGLFFISGGKPFGELTKLVHASSYNLFDLTVGPVTAKPVEKTDELNFFRVPGTSSFERHFALLDISGSEKERKLTIRVMNQEGKELWTRSLLASQLQPNK